MCLSERGLCALSVLHIQSYKRKKKEKSWDERMSAASLEDDDVVLHADADPEWFFFSFPPSHCGLSHFFQIWLAPPLRFFPCVKVSLYFVDFHRVHSV